MIKFTLANLARPLIRRLPFGRVRVLGILGGAAQDDPDWKNCPNPYRVFWDPQIGAYVSCYLGEWGGRWHYYAGRYYEQDTFLVIDRFLRKGDTFIDVGANLGVFSLAAANKVTESGKIFAIEPGSVAFKSLRSHCFINGKDWIGIRNCGCGSTRTKLQLRIAGNHTGKSTFQNQEDSRTADPWVDVVPLDDLVVPEECPGQILIKIDVEGFELEVLKGACSFLASERTKIWVEITDYWLRKNNQSAQEILDLMNLYGFRAFRIRRKSAFISVENLGEEQANYLFVKGNLKTQW